MMFPSQSFKTKDGYMSTVVVPAHWGRFCKALGKPEWIDKPNLSNVAYRVQHYDEMEALVEAVTTTKTTAEWLKIFEKYQVAAGPINSVEEMFEDPQIRALDMIRTMTHTKAGEVKIQDLPWQMSETHAGVRLPPPALGEHTTQILSENGFSDQEISKLMAGGIVAGS
jgi:crotonobetainyl-CoA:carnitine CoA-transferase CaiB-like acyl-CoA transferase